MARPTKNDIDSGIQNWDGKIDDNDEALFNAPIPIHEHSGDETDLESTFAAAAHDRCAVWVDDTTFGWSLYVSDGTNWNRMLSVDSISALTDLTDSTGGSTDGTLSAVSGTGDDTNVNNNFAEVSAKLDAIHALLQAHGLAT